MEYTSLQYQITRSHFVVTINIEGHQWEIDWSQETPETEETTAFATTQQDLARQQRVQQKIAALMRDLETTFPKRKPGQTPEPAAPEPEIPQPQIPEPQAPDFG